MIDLTFPDGTYSLFSQITEGFMEVYKHIADFLNPEYAKGNVKALTQEQHMIAADAQAWCEVACIGECYEDSRIPGMTIVITEP